jgi:hypothetical protein
VWRKSRLGAAALTEKAISGAAASILLPQQGMTKKRFKMSMAALGLLGAFFMVLIAVLLAPTLASANRDPGTAHHHGDMPETGPMHGGPGGGSHIFAENWNETGHGHGDAIDTPYCVEGGVMPCTDGDAAHGFDDAGDPDGFIGDFGAGGSATNGDDGAFHGDGRFGPNFPGAGPGFGGGEGGGPGGDQGGDKTCKTESDSEKDCDNTDPGDTEVPLLTLTLPEGPSYFVDAPSGDDEPKDGPQDCSKDCSEGGDPTITELAPVTEVPEPLTVSLFAAGLAGAVGLRRRSRRRA